MADSFDLKRIFKHLMPDFKGGTDKQPSSKRLGDLVRFIRSDSVQKPKPGQQMVKVVDGVEYAFRWCPPGTFLMGSPKDEEDRSKDETQHEVTLTKGFWMLETPVTQGMWQSVIDGNPSDHQGDDLPVENVNWYSCQRFCRELSGKLGLKISLPTEAQWEYACRAGTTTPFSFGKTLNGDKANCDGNYPYSTKARGPSLGETTPVKRYAPNAWGLYDMHGNVQEWCQDWYGDYPSGSVTDPTGPDCEYGDRVVRGGGWNSTAGGCSSTCRDGKSAYHHSNDVGFRLILSPEVSCQSESQRIEQAVQRQKDTAPHGETRMVKTVDGLEYAFCWCPPGTFLMGSSKEEDGHFKYHGTVDEMQHEVTLTKGFWMLETPVTQKMWQNVMGENPSNQQGDDLPVADVRWFDCQRFCRKLSDKIGLEISLPTEAQWEYACRAGTTTPFSFGWVLNGDKANCDGRCPYGTRTKGPSNGSTPVKHYAPNAWGLYDMHGNVEEWCQDWYGDYPSDTVTDPTGPDNGFERVARGGNKNSTADECRSASRRADNVYRRFWNVGLRLVCSPEESFLSESKRFEQAVQQAVQLQKDTAPHGETRLVKTVNGVKFTFRWCPAGSFLMGCSKNEECCDDDNTLHEVTLTKGFWMLETPVTQEMWQRVMGESVSDKAKQGTAFHALRGKGSNYPMYYISWDDCQDFCEKLSNQIGLKISLPTEAQWEYACRAGTASPFSFGWELNGDRANCKGVKPYGTKTKGSNLGQTTPVKRYAPNAWGLYDMHGNVQEWCQDWYAWDYYTNSPSVDPSGPDSGSNRVYRGGSWFDDAMRCCAASRNRFSADYRCSYLGFRLVAQVDHE